MVLAHRTDKLVLKRQVYCVGDKLKLDKYKAWNNNFIVAGHRKHQKQCSWTYYSIQYCFNLKPDPHKIYWNQRSMYELVIKPVKQPRLSTVFPISKSKDEYHKLQHNFWFLNLQDLGQKRCPNSYGFLRIHQSKVSVENSWMNCIHSKGWKHINRNQATYKRIQ